MYDVFTTLKIGKDKEEMVFGKLLSPQVREKQHSAIWDTTYVEMSGPQNDPHTSVMSSINSFFYFCST